MDRAPRGRRVARAIAAAGLGLVLAVALLALGARAWLASDGGQRWAREAIARQSERRLGLRLEAARVGGAGLAGVALERPVLRDRRGRVLLRAERVTAHASLPSLLAGRARAEVVVDAPSLRLDREARATLAEALDRARANRRAVELRLVVRDGAIELDGRRIGQLELAARFAGDRRRGRLSIERLRGLLDGQPLAASGTLAWDGAHRSLDGATLALGDSRLAARGRWDDARADLALAPIALAPSTIDRLLPPGSTPRHGLAGEASARGPLEALAIATRLDGADGAFALRGTLDARARTLRARLALDGVTLDLAPQATNVRATLQLALAGRVDRAGGLRARLDGSGRYERREPDPNLLALRAPSQRRLARRHAERLPGGAVSIAARAERTADGSLRARFHLTLDERGPAATVARAGRRPPPLQVEGAYHRRPPSRGILTVRAYSNHGG